MFLSEVGKLNAVKDERMRSALLLAIHCAPVLLGVKNSNMMVVSESEKKAIGDFLCGTDIQTYYVQTMGEKGILYLYREKEMAHYLHSEEVCCFLRECGYSMENQTDRLSVLLMCLKKRLEFYSVEQNGFPHEIGLFLEYPLEDVKGFIENAGKNYLYTGYWKVYQDVENAKKKFREYDWARALAVQSVLEEIESRKGVGYKL